MEEQVAEQGSRTRYLWEAKILPGIEDIFRMQSLNQITKAQLMQQYT